MRLTTEQADAALKVFRACGIGTVREEVNPGSPEHDQAPFRIVALKCYGARAEAMRVIVVCAALGAAHGGFVSVSFDDNAFYAEVWVAAELKPAPTEEVAA